jgi:hypothetical protein
MAAFLMFWSVLSVMGLIMALFVVRNSHRQETREMVRVPAKANTSPSERPSCRHR